MCSFVVWIKNGLRIICVIDNEEVFPCSILLSKESMVLEWLLGDASKVVVLIGKDECTVLVDSFMDKLVYGLDVAKIVLTPFENHKIKLLHWQPWLHRFINISFERNVQLNLRYCALKGDVTVSEATNPNLRVISSWNLYENAILKICFRLKPLILMDPPKWCFIINYLQPYSRASCRWLLWLVRRLDQTQ